MTAVSATADSATSVAEVVAKLADWFDYYDTRETHMAGVFDAVVWSFWGPVLDATPDDFPDARADEIRIQMRKVTEQAAAQVETLLRGAAA